VKQCANQSQQYIYIYMDPVVSLLCFCCGTLGSLWGRSGVAFVLLWNHFGLTFGSLLDREGEPLSSTTAWELLRASH
jgi:hypothetical protein